MQIACYKLYEIEKKQNEGKSIGELYHQVYKLSQRIGRYDYLKYTSFVFDTNKDNIVFYLHYKTYGATVNSYKARIEYDFYIIENNGEYYIRYFDMEDLYDKASESGVHSISNLCLCDEALVGLNTKEYKQHVIKNVMSHKIPIDFSELQSSLSDINQEDFESSCGLTYIRAKTSVEILDFKNKITLCTDEFALPKFAPYINFIELIFKKCKIQYLEKCNLIYTESFENAMEILVEKTIKYKYHIPQTRKQDT